MDPYRRGLSGPEMFTFHWHELYVMIPRESEGDAHEVRADIERFAESVPAQFGILSWIMPGAKPPSAGTRREIHQHMTELAPRLSFSLALIQGRTRVTGAFLTVAAALIMSAVAVSAGIELVIDMTDPFSGFVRISSAPMHHALEVTRALPE